MALEAQESKGANSVNLIALCCECAKAAGKTKPVGNSERKTECAICKRIGFHRIYSCSDS